MIVPSRSQQQQGHQLPIFDLSIHGGDCMTSGRELSHWDYAHGKAIIFPYGPGSWRICSFMAWMDRYLLDLCTLEDLPFSYTNVVSTNTSYIFFEQHGHLRLLENAYSFIWTWDSHLCHRSKKIVCYSTSVH